MLAAENPLQASVSAALRYCRTRRNTCRSRGSKKVALKIYSRSLSNAHLLHLRTVVCAASNSVQVWTLHCTL